MNKLASCWRQKIIVLISFSAMFFAIQAVATPLAVASLKPLRITNEISNQEVVKAAEGKLASVTMIFQPDCSWCKKQGKTLAKAFEQCQSSININLVGAKGKTRQLKKELKHYHPSIPAYKADRQFLRAIGGYQASPTTLIYDQHDKLITKKRGFIPEQKLTHAIKVLTQGKCQIQ